MPRAAKNPMTGLTEKQAEFALQVVRLGDANRAYRAAYDVSKMSVSAVWSEARKLLDNPQITLRIAELQEVATRRLEVTVERIALETARIAFFDIRDLMDEEGRPIPMHLLPEDIARAIAGVDVKEIKLEGVTVGEVKKYRIAPKGEALALLMKWKKMIGDKPGEEERDPNDTRHLSDEELEARIAADEAVLKVMRTSRQRSKAKPTAKA